MRYFIFSFVFVAGIGQALAEEKAPPKVTYDDDVKPIFQQKCFSCHNPDKKSADLDLTNYTNLMQGGASGASVEAGDASASYLYDLVTHKSEPIMPPESPKIPDDMIETIRKWIEGGLLENSGSTAKASKKKKFDMGLSAPSTERPAVVPMPARMSLQPIVYSPHRTAVDAIATSPWAPLAALSSHKQVLLYNTQTLDLIGVLPFPEGVPRVLKFSRNGNLLLAGGGVGGASGRVVVWDIQTGDRIIEVGEELDEVLAADISSDQKLVAMAGPQRVLRIYATETGQLLHEIRKHTEWVTSLEFSPDSVLLASGDRNGGLFVWEGWTGREYLALPGHTAAITDVSWRGDSNVVASSSEDATIRLWEMENGGQVKNWAAHGGGALSVDFTRDNRLFSCGRDKVSKLWDQNGTQQIAFEAFGDLAMRTAFCNETNRAISGDWTGEIRVWNAADGARVGQLVMNVPPLENRLAEATQTLAAKQTAHQPLATAFQTAQTAYEKAKSEFETAQKQAADAKAKATAAATMLAAGKETLTKVSADYAAAKKAADEAVAALPVIKNAAETAAAAVAQSPDDTSLATAAATIKATFVEQEKQTNASVAAAAEKLAAMQKATADVATLEKAATETAAAMTVAAANEQRLMPLVKPAEDAFAAAKTAFDQSSAEVAAAQQAVNRWTDELAFGKKMTELVARRGEAAKMLEEQENSLAGLQATADEAAAALAKGDSDLAAAKGELTTNETAYKTALATVETSKQKLVAATQAKNAAAAAVTTLQQVIAKLGETSGKADETLAMQKDDPALVAIAQSVKNVIAEKTKLLETANVDLVAKTEAEKVATAAVATGEKAAADLLAAAPALQKKVADVTAALPPLQKVAQETTAAVEAMKPKVASAQATVEAIASEIATARGLQTEA
jgi:WD40 repeat protein